MLPTSIEHHPRARSLSTGTAPARAVDDAPEFDNTKRAAIPRAASTLGMYNMAKEDQDADDPFRDIAREQVDRETLRDLAHFFRNTRPPTTGFMDPASAENCFGKTGSGDNSKRWSIRSLRRGNKGKPRPNSLQLRDSTILKTTAAGHQYMAISVPANGTGTGTGEGRPSLQSRLSALQKSHIVPVLGTPRRNSSADIQGPISPTSSKTHPSKHDSSDLAAVVSRSSSRLDKNPLRLSIRVSTAEPGVRSLLKLVDEWLEDQHSTDDPQAGKGQRLIGPGHKPRGSVATLLSPVASETVEEEQGEDASTNNTPTTAPTTAPTPTIMVKSALGSSPTANSPEDAPNQTMSLPRTPPPIETQATSFPDLVPRPRSAGASMASRSPESASRVGLSAFPNTSPANRVSLRSPKQQKKPANISVKRTLEVPQSQIQPDSPGFPKMLAAITFPSPPESIRSHSTSNSIASGDPSRPSGTPPMTGRSSTTSPTLSNLDQRLMHQARPTLKHYKSDSAFNSSYVSQRSIASSLGTYDGGSAEIDVAKTSNTRSEHRHKPSYTFNKPSRLNLVSAADEISERRASLDSSFRRRRDSQRQSNASTVDSSQQSTVASDRHRHSIRSDTSTTSDATATDEAQSKTRRFERDSVGSSTFDERRRSETQCSTRSVSSNGTNGTAASLAERRLARRARVREKVQRDLESTKIKNNQVQKPPSFAVEDSVDSPVLGWFPQIGSGGANSHGPKKPTQGPSRLALQSSTPDTPSETTPTQANSSGHAAWRSSVGDISQLIPETVEETTTPVTPNAPQVNTFTFSPIMAEQTRPDGESESEEPSTPVLSLTSIMTVANIEAQSPESTLRPLSLLTTAAIPPIVPPRSILRPETNSNVRQRRLPVRVSKNPLELTVNTDAKSKRNSSPHIPTPPISPDPGSPRLSLAFMKPTSAPPSTNYQQSWSHPPQHSRQTQSLKDKETEWLTNHQRQTAEDWRLAALMRREQLEREMAQETANESGDQDEVTDIQVATVEDMRRKPKERHRRSTLRILNANAEPSSTSTGTIRDTASNVTDDEKTPTTIVTDSSREASQARRASEVEVEQRLLKTLMPLLQNMQSTLDEMQRGSASKELSKKFMDSALAITKPIIEGAEESEERKTGPPSERLPVQ